ncbi:MAG: hypothetical protein WCV90_01365 [Candidatus Woesearchaeota archaeon]|jgi:hypothetical protein
MSVRNTLFGIAALYSGLAFAQPKEAIVEYKAQAQQATSAAEALVKKYQEKDFKLGCVDTIDLFDAFDQGANELKELYAKIPEEQRNTPEVVEATARLNAALKGANQKLKEDYNQRCGFCNGLERDQCESLDDYLTLIQEGISQADRIIEGANKLGCNKTDQAYDLVQKYIQGAKELEEHSQDYIGLLDLVKKKGLSETRQTFWQKYRELERTLESNRCR